MENNNNQLIFVIQLKARCTAGKFSILKRGGKENTDNLIQVLVIRKSMKSNNRTRRTLEKSNKITSFSFFQVHSPTLGIGNKSHLPGVQFYPENEIKEDKNRLICVLQQAIFQPQNMLRTTSSIPRILPYNNTELNDKILCKRFVNSCKVRLVLHFSPMNRSYLLAYTSCHPRVKKLNQ